MIELKKIQKYFPSNGIMALDGVNFVLREKEIHVLLGENGAGKSTLMHIMAGFTKPGGEGFHGDPGTILVNKKEKHFSSPAQSLASGIGMIRQHPHQIAGFTVWENCIIGSPKYSPLWINRRSFRNKVAQLNERLQFDLPLDNPVETLSVSQGQKAAILTLLLRDTQYLIFDEPSAVLSPAESKKLFELLITLKNEGKGIVLISHKLEEAMSIADRVTILRQGKTKISCKAFELSSKELYNLIFGPESKEHTSAHSPDSLNNPTTSGIAAPSKSIAVKPVLELNQFKVVIPGFPLIRGIDLKARQGEILGIAGVRDSGLETLEMSLTGYLPFIGTMRINGKTLAGTAKYAATRIRNFRASGGSYLGQRSEGLLLPIRDLLLIHAHRHFNKHGILNQKKIEEWIESVMDAAKVPRRKKTSAGSFSGGQLQRMLLTREMSEPCSLLVLSDPSRGLDWHYRKRLAVLLREKASEHTAVIIFSTNIEELLTFSDSIAVLSNGVITKTVTLNNENVAEKNTNKNTNIIEERTAKEIIQEAMVGQV